VKGSAVAVTLALLMMSPGAQAGDATLDARHQWSQWRGPLATGVAPHGSPPVAWSETHNVRWKTPIPGKGLSTPIIWGDSIFVTTAVPYGEPLPAAAEHADGAHDNLAPRQKARFMLLAIDRRDGALLWERVARDERPHESTHATGSWASASVVTDGTLVFASFGSQGIHVFDMQGERVWETDLGDMQVRHAHGEGSTPALHGDTLVVNWDHQGQSFLAALDKRDGKQRWKVMRDEITSWSSPLVVEHGGKAQVVVAATRRVSAYDLASGKVIWEAGGLSRNVVASPVAAEGLVHVANSYDWQALLTIRLAGAAGDITGTNSIVWTRERDTPYVPSPLLDGDNLCFLKHLSGVLTCVEAKTGKTIFGPQRLPGIRTVFASPVSAAGRMYVIDRSCNAVVLNYAPKFELLATSTLDDSFAASPAIVGDALYLRGDHHLYCIAADDAE